MKKCLYILGLIAVVSVTNIATTFAAEETSQKSVASTALVQTFEQTRPLNFWWNNFALQADSGALMHDLKLSFELLHEEHLHRMPSYMVNVTGDNAEAFRLLPNGVHFTEPATIAVPYDDFLLPMGYKPKDIKTFYFDEDLAQWKELERVSVDTANHVVISYTTHFTDFANAVIKLPEVPEMKAFVPTAMQDLQDVNPLQGVPMIAPPTANNRGTAELTYPIELPKGRLGMQPNIDLHYSSAGGNDILGVGWSFAQPAITIDTRWGVPRYDPEKETEAYLLNGEQIVLHSDNGEPYPLPHQAGDSGFAVRKYGAVEYFARDTKNQDRIIRNGDQLKDFWWEVTDRYGTTSYYGYNPISHAIDENAVVRTANAAIAYWALTYTVDIFGNYIHYSYCKDMNEVYLKNVSYTGNINNIFSPTDSVIIKYDSVNRVDEIVNGRLGVLQKKRKLVSCITIHYNGTPNAQYVMEYEYGEQTLFKKRLISITKYDTPASSTCGCHQFPGLPPKWSWSHLTNYLNTHEPTGYESVVSHFTNNDGYIEERPGSVTTFQYQNAYTISNLFTSQSNATLPRSFSQSNNHSWSIGGTAAVGFGNIIALTSNSVGGNYSYSHGKGSVSSMMMDLNGDGLPDIVCKNGNNVYYYKQLASGSYADSIQVPGLSELSREVSHSHSFGVQADFVANFSYNPTISTSYTDIYFTDVNGDGLPDLVTPEGVKINHLIGGEPSFVPLQNVTEIEVGNTRCGEVFRTGEVDERLECTNEWILESVIPWQNLLQPTSSIHRDRPLDTSNNPNRPAFPTSNDPDICPEGQQTYFYNQRGIMPLSINGYTDDPIDPSQPVIYVETDTVTYVPQFDSAWYSPDYHLELVEDYLYVYHLETFCHEEDTLPNVDIVRVWVAPQEGTIDLYSNIWLRPDSSLSRQLSRKADGVKYYIQHNLTLLDSATIDADRMDTIHLSHSAISVQEHDVFLFRLSAKNNRKYDDTEWEQTIQYISGGTDLYNSATDYLCTGNNDFVAPCEGSVTIGYTIENEQNEPVSVKVKHNGALLSSTNNPIIIPWINLNDVISFEADSINVEPQWSNVHIHPYVDFTNSSQDGPCPDITGTLRYYPDIHINYSSIISNESDILRKLFGPLHKGWGQFAYNNRDKDDIINFTSLQNTEDAFATYLNNNSSTIQSQFASIDTTAIKEDLEAEILDGELESYISSANEFNPLETNSKWIAMHADSRTEKWVAYGNLGAIGMKLHSTSTQLNSELINGEVSQDIEYDSAIPVSAEQGAPVTTVRKKNFSVQHCISAGFAMINGNFAFGTNEVKMDYTDMNGDGFPDFVSSSSIQYSTPWGGIEGGVKPQLVTLGSNYHTYSQGVGFSGSKNTWGKVTSNGVNRLNLYNSSLGVGINGSYTYNHGRKTFMDINADGLPDMVNVARDSVWYNLGYTFSKAEVIHEDISINEGISHATSSSIGAGISGTLLGNVAGLENLLNGSQSLDNFLNSLHDFSLSQFSLSGGISASVSTNSTNERQIDINGDGYPDRLIFNGNNVVVQLYTNSTPSSQGTISIPFTLTSTTGNLGVNAGLTVGFTPGVLPIKLCFGVQTTPWSGSATQVHSELIDINGDGFIDYILEPLDLDGNAINASVYYNQNGLIPVNMLTTVTNPTGQTIELSYEQTTPSVEQRGRTWRLAGVKDSIIAADETACHRYAFSYKNPYHDNFERADLGYDSVMTIDNRTKVFTETFSNANFISKGEKMSDLLTDSLGRPYIGHSHKIGYKDSHNNPVDSPLCGDASIRVDYDYYQTDYYEGQYPKSVSSRYRLIYDRYHNLISYINEGDTAVSSDNWEQYITYATPESNRWHHNLISLPIIDSVITGGGNVLRLSTAQYNSYGKLEWISKRDPVSSIYANTYIGYDKLGNVAEISFPEDANTGGHRTWCKYEYDHATQSFPYLIYNQHMMQQYMFYDNRFGLPEEVIDPSGNAIIYEYDRTGRLTNVYAPRDTLFGDEPYTVHYRYGLYNHDRFVSHPTYIDPYVIKVGLSEGNASIESTIYDARGHEKQKKNLVRVNNSLSWVADGVREYDVFYRLKKMSLPLISYNSMVEWDFHIPSADSVVFRYDVMDRPVYQRNFDGTTRTDTFSFGADASGTIRLKHIVTDENTNTSFVLQSPQEWTIQTNTPDGFVTKYAYNPIGELIQVIDADNYQTTYQYDAFGNCTMRNHPDAGVTRWTYAPAGNIETMQTNVHINNSQKIEYKYDFGRLKEVHFPNAPFNNIAYEYDKAGHIHMRSDGVGHEIFFYDELGNIRYTKRHVLIPSEMYAYEFITSHYYDSFGRIRHIVYSDGDTVRYSYYASSELESVSHRPSGGSVSTLVDGLRYDIFGHTAYQLYGNGVESFYTYSPQRQWLLNKETRLSGYSDIQDLEYTYDSIGNIKQIRQHASVYNGLGGTYTNNYTYDRQYRLLTAIENTSSNLNVNFSALYSPAGRLGHDFCLANNVNKELTYGYDTDGLTHQPRVVYDDVASQSFDLYWDANGNLAQMIDCKGNHARFHVWDDNNRLLAVIGPKDAGFYGYDGNGERVWKLTGTCQINSQNWGELSYSTFLDNAVLYPNPYLTITPSGYTKHYYLGTERIATALGEGGWNYVQRTLSEDEVRINKAYSEHFERIPCEKFSRTKNEDLKPDALEELQYSCGAECLSHVGIATPYDLLWACINNYQQPSGHHENLLFTHNDHLGSASWITDEGAHPIQYIHYAPYGELLANQSLYGYDERYKFTGKERDAESGYDFYGARFFGSALGHWLSVDPLADKYPGISPYAYCNWNPIKFVDSEGTHPLVAAALAVVAPEIVAATALVGVVIYYNLTHQEERNNTSSWEGNKPFSEVRDTRVGLEWQNRQDRKAKRASELQEMEHQQFLQDNLPDPSPDPNKGKDPKGTAKQLGIGGLIAAGISYAAVFFNDYKQNTTPKVDTNNDLQAQNNENAKIEPLKE